MADHDSSSPSSSFNVPWPALVAVLLAASSAVLYFSPLTSDRPERSEGDTQSIGYQDVDARLWQDPIQAAIAAYQKDRAEVERSNVLIRLQGGSISWPVTVDREPHEAATDSPKATTPATTPASARPATAPRAASSNPPRHSLEELLKQYPDLTAKNSTDASEPLMILPVMVQGDALPEIAEQRHRTRVAVLEALGICGYQPSDVAHIGYFTIDWPRWRMESASNAQVNRELRLEVDASTPTVRFVVPYEWCRRATVPMVVPGRARHARFEQVLVLWVNENLFYDLPLTRLGWLLQRVAPDNLVPDAPINVIGPRVSTTLRAMADEAANFPIKSSKRPASRRVAQARQWLRGITIYSPTATASEEALLSDVSKSVNGKSLSELLENRFQVPDTDRPFAFVRTTLTDQDLCDELVRELARRYVYTPGGDPDFRAADDTARAKAELKADNIALIGEWDTVFGRALPLTFAVAASGRSYRELVDSPENFPQWIKPFVYLRGIDGKTAASSAGEHTESPKAAAAGHGGPSQSGQGGGGGASAGGGARFGAPAEQPEGLNQSDYLRRLADQLAEWDAVLRRDGRRLKAVGVLGTDLYDKLLVLRALRDRLPTGTLFFTTSLDARYNLPSEWRAAHNLIVAAPYGLRLHRYYQGNIPPFRDSYQTATFAATVAALGGMFTQPSGDPDAEAIRRSLGAPRIFEIGRTGAFDLSVDTVPATDAATGASEWSWEPGLPPPAPRLVHPPRPDESSWWGSHVLFTRRWGFFLAMLAVAALVLYLVHRSGIKPAEFEPKLLVSYTTVFLILAIPLTGLLIMALARIAERGGEPFAVAEGISMWPTEAIRIISALLCVHFIFKARVMTGLSDLKVCKAFGLKGYAPPLPPPAVSPPPATRRPLRAVCRWISRFLCPAFDAPEPLARAAPALDLRHWKVFRNDQYQPADTFSEDPDAVRLATGQPANVYAQELWIEYSRRGDMRMRLRRAVWPASAYFAAAFCLMLMLGLPINPVRGHWVWWTDMALTMVMVWLSIVFTFFVIDGTYLNALFIDLLLTTDTHWPQGCHKELCERTGLPIEDLTEYLDVRLVAMRTKVVGKLIYFPFVIFFLMIVSRASLFDNWEWPFGLLLIMTTNVLLAVIGAMMLRRAAERVREAAVKKLTERRIAYLGSNKRGMADALDLLTADVRHEREGAFSVLSQYPWLAAVVLPSSGIGIWILLEYLPRMLG